MNKSELREALYLWIPTNGENATELLNHFLVAREALDSFLDGKLSLNDYLEILSTHSVDMDSYEEIVEENLLFF